MFEWIGLLRHRQSPDIDTGWALVIAGAAMAATAVASGTESLHLVQHYKFGGVLFVIKSTFSIRSGVYFTFSMYFPLLLDEFQASRATTAWVGSLNNGIYMLAGTVIIHQFLIASTRLSTFVIYAGPIATMSIQRFGCRLTIMLGGTISMIGLAVSSVAPNLLTLFFTYGVITGIRIIIIVFIYYKFDCLF